MSVGTRMTVAAAVATILGSAPIGSTFHEQQWVTYAWLGVLVIMLVNLLARRLRVPAVLVPVFALAVFFVYLTVAFTPEHTLVGLIPTPESVREFESALRDGFDDVRTLATPAPATPGLKLVTAGSVGLVAIVIDTIAVGMRRPAASGLVLLALYAVPAAVAFDGVGWFPFVLAGSGYLVLLLAEGHERILRWGRPVPYDDHPGQEAREWPVRVTGKRIGVAAVLLAVLVPLVTPGFNNNTLYLLVGSGDGDGTGKGRQSLGGTSLNPFTQMRNQLLLPTPQDVMEITTQQRDPFYLRQMVLDQVDRQGNWRRSRLSGGEDASGSLNLPSGTFRSNDEQVFRATFHVSSIYDDSTLPLYGLPTSLNGLRGDWHYIADLTTAFTRTGSTRGLRYTEAFVDPRPSEEQLRASPQVADAEISGEWGRYPSDLPTQVKDTVDRLVDGRTTPYERTLAIYDYFLRPDSGFVYSLSTKPGTSGNDLVDFLTNKQGFCQQYASAMAVMLRVAGVPSRVAVGYTPGTLRDGTWVVQTDDAHAWVEAYFSGVGWVSFDPTPLPDSRRVEQAYAPRPGATAPGAPSDDTATVSPGPQQTDPNKLEPADRQSGATATSSGNQLISPRVAVGMLVVVAVLLVLLSPLLSRTVLRRRRLRHAGGPDTVLAAREAWDEVLATAEDYRLTVHAADTPRALAHRLVREQSLSKPAGAGLRLVALAEERARYAPRAGVDGDLPTAVRAVRRGLREVASRRRRWRARLLPPSVTRIAQERLAQRWAQASSAVDRLGSLLRRPLGSRQ